MPSKNTTLDLHKTLAHEIKAAKKVMFKRHREGMPLREAANKFVVDMTARFQDVVPDRELPLTRAGLAARTSNERADDGTVHTTNILTDKQQDYANWQTVALAETGPSSGLAALIKHFRDLALTGRAEEAKADAAKCLGALAKVGFEKASRDQFLEDMKLDTGCEA